MVIERTIKQEKNQWTNTNVSLFKLELNALGNELEIAWLNQRIDMVIREMEE